jgi:hypothetical protein
MEQGAADTLDVQGAPAELQPARAIRRALAAARLKALEVGYVCVVAPEDIEAAFVEHVIHRAFGDHVNHIETDLRRVPHPSGGDGGANDAERACVDWLAAGRTRGAVAVHLGFGGRTRALAVRVVE